MKKTKKLFMQSTIVLVLCISMLIGTTFAWFSDSVTSRDNVITSGNLDLEMYWTDNLDSGEWFNVEDDEYNTIFNYDNWEPGYTDVKYIKLVNAGELALNYQLTVKPQNGIGKLSEVINVYYLNEGVNVETRDDLKKLNAIGLLSNVMNGGATANGTLLAADQQSPLHESGEVIITLAMSMITTAGNEYQNETIGAGFTVNALATQAPYENDSFGSDYDTNASYPAILNSDSASSDVVPVDGKVPEGGITLSGSGVSAFIPEGTALEEGANKLTLTVTPLENTTSDITVVNNEILIPVDVHIEGVSDTNNVPIIIDLGEVLPKYLNMGNYRLFHVEDGVNKEMVLVENNTALVAHNQFTYDSDTGAVSVAMASFSEVALVADTANEWKGEYDYKWYGNGSATEYTITKADDLAALSKIVGGMDGYSADDFGGDTIKLVSDINLADGAKYDNGTAKIFYPIGYYNSVGNYVNRENATEHSDVSSNVRSFKGVFDGNGHSISHFYQNTWDMFGDYNNGYSGTPNYYKDAMGLFGYVNGGTVKNLTVNDFSSDGEFTPTGVVAAFAADATFENIAITNCNPRVYNTGNGGIVGIGGNSDDTEASAAMNFSNITVDNSNKISALWGSWDVACGGLMGMFRGYSTVKFDNCHVAAQIDVYNDVCGNYQYYWYRYAGMIIGSLRGRNITSNGYTVPDMTGITATDCTVHFGDWNDYYYCELVHNTIASYTHEHQFSRLERVYKVDVNKMTYQKTADSEGTAIPTSGSYNFVVVPDGAYGTNAAECYHFVDGKVHNHEDAGFEDFDLNSDGELNDYKEDNAHIFLPFNQLFQGDGWGVKHIALGEFDGIKILERDVADSVEKFTAKCAGKEYATGEKVKIGDLFASANNSNVEIKSDRVKVFVSPNGEDSTASGTYTANATNWQNGTLTFNGVGSAKVTISDYYFCKTTTAIVTVTNSETVDKFDIVFPNTNTYTYRVGNMNSVSIGSLFKALDGKTIGNVTVTVTALEDGATVSGETTPNASAWNNGTIQFKHTGIVSVTISDDNKAKPVTLNLEVVDAKNATTAASATANSVVLLNDMNFSTIEVSGGYTLYGNGFTMTAPNDVRYHAMNAGFVTLNGGILDNVQIKCPNFSHSIIYNKNITEDANQHAYDSNSQNYGNVRSAVMADGNSSIVNSYVHGGRAAVFVRSGNVLIDNSTISGGAAANIHAISAKSLTLRDVTLIQKPLQATVHDTTKTLIGLSGLFECDETGASTPLNLEGTLIQDAWVDKSYSGYIPSGLSSVVETALTKTDYLHDIDDDGTDESLNLGFTFIPQTTGGSVKPDIKDNRTNKTQVPYDSVEVGNSLAKATVYSYKNTNGTSDDFVFGEEDIYTPTVQGVTAPSVSYSDTSENRVFTTVYDETNGWSSTLTVDLDAGDYTFDFSKLITQKNGKTLSYTINTADESNVTATTVALKASGVREYVLKISDPDGVTVHTYYFTLISTKSSIPEPERVTPDGDAVALLVVKSKNGDWSCAIPALEGIKIKYYTSANNSVTLDLATLTPSDTGQPNGTNNFWETTKDGYKLKVTCGYIHDTKQVYGMPVVVNNEGNKMYFTISNTNGYVSTNTASRTVTITYEFTDPNGKTLTFDKTWQFNYSDYSNGTQYSYDEFVKGTLKEADGCFTADTLITLADGSQKRIDNLTYTDELLVWDFFKGEYTTTVASAIYNHGDDRYTVTNLHFSDGTTVKMLIEHEFFDVEANSFVYITESNVSDYIGHQFVKQDGDGYTTVTLVDYIFTEEYTGCYTILTAGHYNCIAEGMFSMTSDPTDTCEKFFRIFEVGDGMKYDVEKMQAIIDKYGLYEYEVFADYATYEEFVAFGGAYFKILVEQGELKFEDILVALATYAPKS